MRAGCSVFIATSLDGFIARKDGSIDWLTQGEDDTQDFGYKEFTKDIDMLIMGRSTYETVVKFDSWPYEKPVVVLSSQEVEIPQRLRESVECMSGHPQEIVSVLGERGLKHFYIDGGVTIQRFLNAGMIQKMIISRIPILIGSGIPLFGSLDSDIRLNHVKTTTFDCGIVQSEYLLCNGSVMNK